MSFIIGGGGDVMYLGGIKWSADAILAQGMDTHPNAGIRNAVSILTARSAGEV